MSGKNTSNCLELKNTLNLRQSKLQSLKNENSKMLEFEATKLDQLNSLYDCLVKKYKKMKTKHTETKKNLDLSITENARFKLATQCLTKKIKELTGFAVNDECSEERDRFKDDAFSLQEWSNKLMRELSEYRKKAEGISEELHRAKKQLAVSRASRKDLKKCLDHLMMLEDRDEKERDWRAVYERLSADLAESRRVKNQLREALSAKVDEIKLMKQSAAEDVDVLRSRIVTLRANLEEQVAREDAVRARIARSEVGMQLDVVCPNRSTTDSRMSRSSHPDQYSWNVSQGSRNQGHDGDKSASGLSENLSEFVELIESSPSTIDDST